MGKSGNNRVSLSDWWKKGDQGIATPTVTDGSDQEEEDQDKVGSMLELTAEQDKSDSACNSPRKQRRFSPTRRGSVMPAMTQVFSMGDDSDCGASTCQSLPCSPRKRSVAGGDDANVSTAMMSILRRICSEYFENNVSPVLKFVQQTQEQLVAQVKELSEKVERKANSEDVATLADVEQVANRVVTSRTDNTKVAVHVRLEEIASAMNQKANAINVPTLAQFALKANAKDVATSAQLAELAAAVAQKAGIADTEKADQGELEKRVQTAEGKVATLTEELRELKAAGATGVAGVAVEPAEAVKLKALFVAAGLRVEKQLKSMRQQIQQLGDDRLGKDCTGKEVGGRWPGRKLDEASVASLDKLETQSVNSNDSEGRLSLDRLSCGSSARCSTALDPEEKIELRRIQTIVAAAGRMLDRDVKGLKREMSDLKTELKGVKSSLDAKID